MQWCIGYSVRFAVGKPEVHVESYQKTFKTGIHSFPAWCSAFMGGCGEEASRFAFWSLSKALDGMPPPLRGRQVAQFFLRIEGWWQEGHPTIKQMPCYKNADICCGDP